MIGHTLECERNGITACICYKSAERMFLTDPQPTSMNCTCGPCPVHGLDPLSQLLNQLEDAFMTPQDALDQQVLLSQSLQDAGFNSEPDTACRWCSERYRWPGTSKELVLGGELNPVGRFGCPHCGSDSTLFGEQDKGEQDDEEEAGSRRPDR